MEVNVKKNELLDNEIVITEDNIVKLSRIIALSAIKNMKKYAYCSIHYIENLHRQLQADICYHKPLDVYSNAYDVVQEASCFLSYFIGHKLGEMCIKSKTRINKIDSIRFACYKVVYAYLRKEMKHGQCEDEELLDNIIVEDSYFNEQPDFSKVKLIVSKLVTNDLERKILYYYYDGVQPKLIAEFLNVSEDIVYKRRRKFKDRYLAYCM